VGAPALADGVAGTAFNGAAGTVGVTGAVGAGARLDLTSDNAAGGDGPADIAGVSAAGRLS